MIELREVSKAFGGVTALERVSLAVTAGSCHALLGENGAGKSTLGRILCGIHRPDGGEVRLDGAARHFASPADALAAGVAMVHQELALCPELSVAENLALGRYPRRGWRLDRRAMETRARALLGRVGARLDVRARVGALSTAAEQMVQIAAAVGTGARVLVLDEPTSSLSAGEAERLFELVEQLRGEGLTILYVSHRLPEVFRLCDRMSVLRDGRLVATLERDATDTDALVRLMIGREPPARSAAVPARSTGGAGVAGHAAAADAHAVRAAAGAARTVRPAAVDATPAAGAVLLEARGLSSPGRFADVSLTLRAGEIVGLAGLVGAGRSDVAAALFGLDRAARGEVRVADARGVLRPLRLGSARRAMDAGLALVPEDRKRQGLVPGMSVLHNASLARLAELRRGWRLDRAAERREAGAVLARLELRGAGLRTPVAALSGGNQQKVVLARWLLRAPRVALVDEPTRGVDVGAKAAIHELLLALAADGAAVLLVSSELPELLALSSRILVMRAGRLVGELGAARSSPDDAGRRPDGPAQLAPDAALAPAAAVVRDAALAPADEETLLRLMAGLAR